MGRIRHLFHAHHRFDTIDHNTYSSSTQSRWIHRVRTVCVFFPLETTKEKRREIVGFCFSLCRKVDIWLVRFLVHNGLAVYTTWLYLATLLNFTIWVSRIYNRDAQSISDVSTAALSLVLVGIVVYFVCENLIFYSAMAYTYLPWFVLIFALSGIMSKNYNRTDVSSRNKQFTLALLILCCILFAIRVVIFIIRYIMQKIPTFKNP